MIRDKVDIRVIRSDEEITVFIFKDKAKIDETVFDQLKNTSGELFNLLSKLYIKYNVQTIRFYEH